MDFYSTGTGNYLPPKGRKVECSEEVGERLIKKGVLVSSLEQLSEKKVILTEKPISQQVKEQIIEVPKKKKGNPNFGKKKV